MRPSTSSAHLRLPLDLHSPARAREFLRDDACCAALDPAVIDRAELLVSELVTNAVRYGGPPITMVIACDDHDELQVRVSDGSTTAPVARAAQPLDESGRGMALMDLVSDEWGVEPTASGKAVWFRVTL